METNAKQKKLLRIFLIVLAATVLCSVLNWGVVTGWGNVQITQLSLVGDNGSEYTALMYVPKNATNETPAPALLTMMGASGNARNHEQYAVEYARRGFVVVSVDNFGSGDATYDPSVADAFRTKVPELFWHYMENCSIIDMSRTVVSGHSVGSTAALHMAAWFNPTVCVPVDGYSGVYPSKDEQYYTGMICAVTGNSDAMNSDEMLLPLGDLFRLDERISFEGDVELNKVYGSFEDGSAKAIYLTNNSHEDAMNSGEGMQVQLDFVQQAMEVPNPIAGSNQVWIWKDVFGQVGMFAFAFMLMSLALVMVSSVDFFKSIDQPMPRNIGLRGKGLVISIICAFAFPLIVMKTGCFGLTNLLKFGAANGSNLTAIQQLFYAGRATRAFSVVIGLSLLGLITFILFLLIDGKKQNAKLCDYGVTSAGSEKMDWVLIGKSALLALIVLFIGFAYLRLQREVFGTDFYCLYWGYKPIAWSKFIHHIPFILVWILCFVMSGVGMNVERRLPSTGNETKDTAIALVVNVSLAVIAIAAVVMIQLYMQHHVMLRTGTAMSNWNADLTRLWGMPAGLAVGSFGNTYLYHKTGNIWLGVFLMGTLCALGCVIYGAVGLFG